MYTGESGQPSFGYGMEGQQNYGQEQDPYSVSYYQAAAAQYQRSIGKFYLCQWRSRSGRFCDPNLEVKIRFWLELTNKKLGWEQQQQDQGSGGASNSTWNNQQTKTPVTSAQSPSSANYYQATTSQPETSSNTQTENYETAQNIDKPMTGRSTLLNN